MRTGARRAGAALGAGLLAAGLVLPACSPAPAEPDPAGRPGSAPAAPVFTIGARSFTVEVRDTAAGRAQGLSGRPAVPAGTGMLFVYPDAAVRSFWMSGMLVPIDIAWIGEGAVLGVDTLAPCPPDVARCPTYSSPGPADTVLEVAAGALSGIAAGEPAALRR